MHAVLTHRRRSGLVLALILGVAVALGVAINAGGAAPVTSIRFQLDRSGVVTSSGCLPKAFGKVAVVSKGTTETMRVQVFNLPKNTEFDLFVTQIPNAPFGLSWYQGDIETNSSGRGEGIFVGRFNIETFIVAPNTAPAPTVHETDASTNPATGPVHTFHVGLWFNSPADAVAAGCPGATTPFNGDHTAGVQVLSTRAFPDTRGPLLGLGS